MHINFWVETDVLLIGQGPGKSNRGILETRRSGKEDGPIALATSVCIFVPHVNTHCRGVTG